MKKTFKISATDEIVISNEKMKKLQSQFADLKKYNITESQQIAYLELVCNLTDNSLKTVIQYSHFLSDNEILLSELMKMVKSLPQFHFKIIDGYYGFTGEPKTLTQIASELNKPIEVIEFKKTEIINEFKKSRNYFVSCKIKMLEQEIKNLQSIKNGIF